MVGIPVEEALVPAELLRLNFIQFTADRSFARSLGELADALRLDIEWIREHTRLAELAERWNHRERPEALLLRGEELTLAQAWMIEWKPGAPSLTDAHREFVSASVDSQERRASEEHQRNEAMAQANDARALALANKEEALVLLRRRTLQGASVAFALALGLGGMLWWSNVLRVRAREAEKQSIGERIRVESLRAGRSSRTPPCLDSLRWTAATRFRLTHQRCCMN
ncbi:hypothetical protein [Variovorax sp. GT1P44]|uniref:hypothetical protein n=1 Tax=Variovorax sp. GT1P44 TaxID=3443742 RepID=UPI003F46E9A8